MARNDSNPVIKIINGIEIRKNNYHTITFGEQAYQDLVEESVKTGLSIAKLVAIKSQPCQACGCSNISIIIKKDGRANKQNTGANIIAQNAKRH